MHYRSLGTSMTLDTSIASVEQETDQSSSENSNSDRSESSSSTPPRFLPTVYLASFLLSLGPGFLSGKTSFITINWFAGRDCTGVENDACNSALNRYTAASGVCTFASLGVAMVLVPVLTRASDAIGRRLFIQVGAVMSCWSLSVVLYQFTGLSMWMMFILSFIASQSPVSTVSVASIFDVTSPSEKSSVIGRRSALSSIGGFIGLGVSYALNDNQASAACLVCMCLSIIVHGFFWPETLPSSRRVPFSCGSVNPLKPLVFFFQSRPYRYLFFVMLVEQLAGSGYNALIFNYAVKTFHVSQSLFVAVLATFMLGSTLVPGLLLPLLKQKFGVSDSRLIVFGLIGMATSFGVIAFIPDLVCFFAASATLGLGGLIAPAASSIVSSRIPDSEQGLAQGAFSAIQSLSAVLAQVTFDALFIVGNTQFDNPGFAFIFAFGFCIIALICAVIFQRLLVDDKPYAREADHSESLISLDDREAENQRPYA